MKVVLFSLRAHIYNSMGKSLTNAKRLSTTEYKVVYISDKVGQEEASRNDGY
jgi:hypothetical protein